jgi:N,N'-diacetyllegionaminate synthase
MLSIFRKDIKMKTFIIAEAGANHNKNFQQALALIDVAIEAQASAVKFQTYSSETLYSKHTPDFAGYKNIPKLIKDIELPRSWQKDLKLYCDDNGIEFMSTPFDERAVDELYNLGVKRFKIAGFEATDPRFVRHVAATNLPLIVSAGIGVSLKIVGDIISWIEKENKDADITILHCNNAYPTPIEDINLLQISRIREEFSHIKIGLSDHTTGILVPPLAVAMGAQCIEKHYTISNLLPGPDHPFAIEPIELKNMVQNIRLAEKTLAEKKDKISSSELEYCNAMRSVVANCNIKKGEPLTFNNVTTKRPFLKNSIPAIEYYGSIGRISLVDIKEDEILTYDMIQLE